MMIQEKLQEIIQKIERLDPEYDYGIKQCWKEEIELLTRDINATIDFLDHECTSEQFVWISEIFDELVEKTQSRALIECFYRAAKRFPKEASDYYLIRHIKMSEDFLLE